MTGTAAEAGAQSASMADQLAAIAWKVKPDSWACSKNCIHNKAAHQQASNWHIKAIPCGCETEHSMTLGAAATQAHRSLFRQRLLAHMQHCFTT
jgi:hypothetical protein